MSRYNYILDIYDGEDIRIMYIPICISYSTLYVLVFVIVRVNYNIRPNLNLNLNICLYSEKAYRRNTTSKLCRIENINDFRCLSLHISVTSKKNNTLFEHDEFPGSNVRDYRNKLH